jgi:beta-phosphoglucomutase-like phosphatase (HAD superfamily)
MTQAVVFDFDGVLADTEALHLRAFQAIFRSRGWTLDRAVYFDRYLGYDDHDLVGAYVDDARLPVTRAEIRQIVDRKVEWFERERTKGALLFPTAAGAIARLGTRYALAIASGSLAAEITAILEPAGLTAAFQVIVGADSVVRSKPAADPYLLAVQKLGVGPAAAVAIEDSHWGLTSARTAGLRTIGITTSYPASALSDADTVVGSLDEVTVALVEDLLAGRAVAPRPGSA